MISYIIYSVLTVLFFVGLYKVFEKAGQNKWAAFIPVYNLFIWMKVIKKPSWWLLILIFPGVNFLMFMVMCAQTVYCFNKRSFIDTLLAAFLPFFYIPYVGNDPKLPYVGPSVITKKSTAKEWVDALLFAIIAASIIRGYFLEAFTIPTSSLEKTLLKGDYLFVSKINYGPKIPNTPLSFPFAHHTIPGTRNVKSYLNWIKLPYYRLPGFQDVKRNELVVFNFPEGDTVLVDIQDRSYYQVMREFQMIFGNQIGRELLLHGAQGVNMPPQYLEFYKTQYLPNILQGLRLNFSNRQDLARLEDIYKNGLEITVRPVDKQENYIKRCVGIPGDKLEFKNAELIINDQPAFVPEHIQFRYIVKTTHSLNKKDLKLNYDINPEDVYQKDPNIPDQYEIVANPKVMDAIAKAYNIEAVVPMINTEDKDEYKQARVFPNDTNYRWTQDNFGPVVLPKRGMVMHLDPSNIAVYKRAIQVYENNQVEVKDGKIFINGKETDSYTFKMNYYMLIGDNRHNSLDSRYWGFVPEDHVVGKAVFIWMSIDPDLEWSEGALRWKRFFRLAHREDI